VFGSVDSSELGTRFVQRAGCGNAALGRGRLLLAGGRRQVARQRVGVRGRQAEGLVVARQHVGQHRGGRRRSLCWMKAAHVIASPALLGRIVQHWPLTQQPLQST
jgi:hypothetical protein